MMNFDEFLESVKEHIQAVVPDAEVRIQQVNKLQGESYTGISVQPEGANAAATFNINHAYEYYQADQSKVSSILDKIAADAKEIAGSMPIFNIRDITDYETVKNNLLMQVVPAEANKEMLEGIPHKTVGDIAVVYRIDLQDATTLVTNQLLEEYGITAGQLHADAVTAQIANHPPVLKNMSEVMADISGGMFDIPESPMWVASIEGGMNGASVTQIPGFLEESAERLGGDFFVLPSSVHEVLFVPDDGSFERTELENMVRGVNAQEVSEADFLSNSVYHYDSVERIFEKAETFEARVAESPDLYRSEMGKTTMTVLLVEPEKHPRPVEIGTSLEDLQKVVGGFIEVTYPFEDQVGLVMNEEGKLEGLPLNRALRDDEGKIYDIVAGSFLVVGLTEDDFGSLSPDQMQKYEELFHQPEVFVRMGKGVMALPIPDEAMQIKAEKAAGHVMEDKPRRKAKEETL